MSVSDDKFIRPESPGVVNLSSLTDTYNISFGIRISNNKVLDLELAGQVRCQANVFDSLNQQLQ